MEMARKREHFGLSYLEELSILKERDIICKESRQKFLKFKQKADNVERNLNKPSLEVTRPDLSHQLEPNSCQSQQSPLLHENMDLPVEWYTFKTLKTGISPDVSVTEHQAQHLETQQKKPPKKENSEVVNHLDKDEKGPVAIASLVGTAKQVSILKKPEPLPKSKYRKFVRVKSVSEKPLISQQEVHDTRQPEQKIYSQLTITENVGTSSTTAEISCSNAMDSDSNEKPLEMATGISKPSILNTLLELEGSYSEKISEVSDVTPVSGSLQETRGMRRSKIYEKSFLRSQSLMHDSQKFPAEVVARSIDEIIASLQSTAPTPSDLRIKELIESVLGHEYNIKIEPQVIESENVPGILESPFKEAAGVEMEQLKAESWTEEHRSPAEQATPADNEQTQLISIAHLSATAGSGQGIRRMDEPRIQGSINISGMSGQAFGSCGLEWLKRSWLKLNPARMEVLWLGWQAKRQLTQLPSLGDVQLTLVSTVKSLGVILDASLSMEAQITKVAHQVFFHLCQACHLLAADLATVIHATVRPPD